MSNTHVADNKMQTTIHMHICGMILLGVPCFVIHTSRAKENALGNLHPHNKKKYVGFTSVSSMCGFNEPALGHW